MQGYELKGGEIVRSLGYIKITVGVESLHEALPLIVQVCLNGKLGVDMPRGTLNAVMKQAGLTEE